MTLDGAIRLGLERNPELMAFRQQRGVAEGTVVIAQTYPFNPVWEAEVRAAFGPPSAGVTNSVSQVHRVFTELEVHGQRGIRREGAAATLSRTDADIVAQETTLAVRVTRAFDTVLYRSAKNALVEETIAEYRRNVTQVEDLVKARQVKPVDLIIIRTEMDDVAAQLERRPDHADGCRSRPVPGARPGRRGVPA